MGKLWIPGGGSGAGSGSDECTASKSEVLKGYSAVTSDSDDEPAQGTLELTGDASDGQVLSGKTYYNTDAKKKRNGSMANQGAVSVKLNAGEGYTIPSGFHNGGGKVEANGLASQTGGTATAAHILSGQSAWVYGNKVDGAIPLQNADVAGSDRAWSQGMSNWAGTINLKVRNGCYLNGVNWIQQSIPEYQPWNIKKGVNIGGVVGTFEGYVAGAADLYYKGNNVIGFTSWRYVRFDTVQLAITAPSDADGQAGLRQSFNTTGFSRLNIHGIRVFSNNSPRFLLYYNVTEVMYSGTRFADIRVSSIASGEYTISVDISGIQGFYSYGLIFEQGFTGTIDHIWLS